MHYKHGSKAGNLHSSPQASVCMRDVALTAAPMAKSHHDKVIFRIDYCILPASAVHGVGSAREVKGPPLRSYLIRGRQGDNPLSALVRPDEAPCTTFRQTPPLLHPLSLPPSPLPLPLLPPFQTGRPTTTRRPHPSRVGLAESALAARVVPDVGDVGVPPGGWFGWVCAGDTGERD